MRVLYYCPEYYCRHGGRSHARGFYGALQDNPHVSKSFLYPKTAPQANSGHGDKRTATREKLRFLPSAARQVIRFFKPKLELTSEIISEIKANSCNVLIIRTGFRLPIVRKIQKACPGVTVCLEINSAFFDESFPGIPLRSVLQKLEVMQFRRADAIVVVSSYLKSYLEDRGIASDKILVNQNGVNEKTIGLSGVGNVKQDYDIPENAFVVGYVGGMETFRRLPEVVGFFAELRRYGHDDLYFLIAGDGVDMQAVKDAVEADKEVLGDSVKLAGWQEQSELPRFLNTFDLAIFPFTNDYCSPLKLFEYLGAGIPTIGPDTSAVREIFEDGVHLKLVKQDGSNFISAVIGMIADPESSADLGKNGQRLVLSQYTWKQNAERVIKHIQSVSRQPVD
jgi:glycosyltransferase involved in cell wall biosynthesis